MKEPKSFMTYTEQIELLKSKGLTIEDESNAIRLLKKYSYYSLISGYKDVFKTERNGKYRSDATFDGIALLYTFDSFLKFYVLQQIIKIENQIKSLYSYSFCELYGDKQSDYLNVNNYNYIPKYQTQINNYVSLLNSILKKPSQYPNIEYNVNTYGSVPLWIMIHSLTFGNVSKLYTFSNPELQSRISHNFNGIFEKQLSAILNVFTKFRNVCAHGERLYNYKTQKALPDTPLHKKLRGKYNISKNDLFNVCICLRPLLSYNEYISFVKMLDATFRTFLLQFNEFYHIAVLESMGFPDDWQNLLFK